MRNFLLFLSVCAPLFAQDQVFTPAPGKTPMTFEIPYTAGVHKGTVKKLSGELTLDEVNRVVSGKFTVPITEMKTNNDTRDCHMREALGIEYSKSSFPAEHVCDVNNQTPTSGPDSIAYPNIEFEISAITLTTGEPLPTTLEENKAYSVLLKGRFSLHGQTRILEAPEGTPIAAEMQLVRGVRRQLELKSTFPISLKNYGIKVKPSQAGPITISVSDKSTVKLNLLMNEQSE